MHPPAFNRCYWVVPKKLMAGCYPGSKNETLARNRLQLLLRLGIRHFINLMEPDEAASDEKPIMPYEPLLAALCVSEEVQASMTRIPIRDFSTPSKALMIHILDTIDARLGEDKSVYVHCFGGRGRTGTVVGCYLARHGFAVGKRVPWLIQKLRKDLNDYNLPSPETHRQMDMVVSWQKGE